MDILDIMIARKIGGGGGGVTVEQLNVTENGIYTAPSGKAYSPVSVNVSGGGGDSLFGRKAVTGSVTFVSQTPNYTEYEAASIDDLIDAFADEFPGVENAITKFYTKDRTASYYFYQYLNAAYFIDPDSVRSGTQIENAGGVTFRKDHSTRKFAGAKISSSNAWSYANISETYGVLQIGLILNFNQSVGYGLAGSKYNWFIWCDEHGEVVS